MVLEHLHINHPLEKKTTTILFSLSCSTKIDGKLKLPTKRYEEQYKASETGGNGNGWSEGQR